MKRTPRMVKSKLVDNDGASSSKLAGNGTSTNKTTPNRTSGTTLGNDGTAAVQKPPPPAAPPPQTVKPGPKPGPGRPRMTPPSSNVRPQMQQMPLSFAGVRPSAAAAFPRPRLAAPSPFQQKMQQQLQQRMKTQTLMNAFKAQSQHKSLSPKRNLLQPQSLQQQQQQQQMSTAGAVKVGGEA